MSELQSFISYIESLEQRLAALETRIEDDAKLEVEQEARIAVLEARIAELEKRPEVSTTSQQPLIESEPEIEVELIMDEEDEIEEEMTEIQPEPEVEAEPVVEAEPEVEAVAEPEAVVEPEPEVEVVAEPEVEAVAEPEVEAVAEPEVEAVAEPEVEAVAEPEPQVVTEPEPAPQVEKPKPHLPMQTSLFGAPVADIRHAISLGDRFLFQRELFGGKGELMQKTLDQLNQLSTLEEAKAFVDNKFQWDKESGTYELFMNVLRRRF